MPAATVIPGFFGKIPATGDFVQRNLAPDFVRGWDRWVARHLAPLLGSESWPEDTALRLLLGPGHFGPMAGLVLPSGDRVGRRFPLTVAMPLPSAHTGFATQAEPWFDEIEQLADAARNGDLHADDFAALLAQIPPPSAEIDGEPVHGIALWTPSSDIILADPDAPRPALDHLLAARVEPG